MKTDRFASLIPDLIAEIEEVVPVVRLDQPVDGIGDVTGVTVWEGIPRIRESQNPVAIEVWGNFTDVEQLFWVLAHERGHLVADRPYWSHTPVAEILAIEEDAWERAWAYAATLRIMPSKRIRQWAKECLESYASITVGGWKIESPLAS